MDITYHYPPELFNILIDTIPLLNKSKKDVILFFRGAGVSNSLLDDLNKIVIYNKDSISKYEITRKIITRLNEKGESTLRERRELLKRIVEFEDFSSCYPDDQLKAKGLVADIRKIIDVKDSFTKMKNEREKERQKYISLKNEEILKVKETRENRLRIKEDFCSLFKEKDHQKRGRNLEKVINRLFVESKISIRESISIKGDNNEGIIEQIDGVIEINSSLCLVEIKWWNQPIGVPEISIHLSRIFLRSCVSGIFISASGYSDTSITTCKEALSKITIALCTIEEIYRVIDAEKDLKKFFEMKINAAKIEKDPFCKIDFNKL